MKFGIEKCDGCGEEDREVKLYCQACDRVFCCACAEDLKGEPCPFCSHYGFEEYDVEHEVDFWEDLALS